MIKVFAIGCNIKFSFFIFDKTSNLRLIFRKNSWTFLFRKKNVLKIGSQKVKGVQFGSSYKWMQVMG